jgi:hypothetical protein
MQRIDHTPLVVPHGKPKIFSQSKILVSDSSTA